MQQPGDRGRGLLRAHPLPMIFNWSLRPMPFTAVTQPSGQPIIHWENAAFSRLPPLVLGCVGGGAGRVNASQRAIAG